MSAEAPNVDDILNKIQEGYAEARKVNAKAVLTQFAINGGISVSTEARRRRPLISLC